MSGSGEGLEALWARHNAEWRDTAQIASQWREAARIDRALLRHRVRGRWWETLAEAGGTLLVTREYEHLVMALSAAAGGPEVTYLPLPHPSGLAVDEARGVVHLASTRNPNQIYDLVPVTGVVPRSDVRVEAPAGRPLVPIRSRFYPGSLYLHELALLGGELYGNAVGWNAVVHLAGDGRYAPVWWPRSIDSEAGPIFGRNHLQLNSIAAGEDLSASYFSASAEKPSARRPGHRNFPVDRRGVVFSGATREPVARGLTRPHSARRHGARVWVDDSGYGELVAIDPGDGRRETVARLPGWTRGLCLRAGVAFVATSRVIPRFRQYAPGLEVDASECGVHAVDTGSGRVLGSLVWPRGNQIFAVEWAPSELTTGFLWNVRGRRPSGRDAKLFYAFATQ